MTRKLGSDEFILVKNDDEDEDQHSHFWTHVCCVICTG